MYQCFVFNACNSSRPSEYYSRHVIDWRAYVSNKGALHLQLILQLMRLSDLRDISWGKTRPSIVGCLAPCLRCPSFLRLWVWSQASPIDLAKRTIGCLRIRTNRVWAAIYWMRIWGTEAAIISVDLRSGPINVKNKQYVRRYHSSMLIMSHRLTEN
jgi:hypothetical protein